MGATSSISVMLNKEEFQKMSDNMFNDLKDDNDMVDRNKIFGVILQANNQKYEKDINNFSNDDMILQKIEMLSRDDSTTTHEDKLDFFCYTLLEYAQNNTNHVENIISKLINIQLEGDNSTTYFTSLGLVKIFTWKKHYGVTMMSMIVKILQHGTELYKIRIVELFDMMLKIESPELSAMFISQGGYVYVLDMFMKGYTYLSRSIAIACLYSTLKHHLFFIQLLVHVENFVSTVISMWKVDIDTLTESDRENLDITSYILASLLVATSDDSIMLSILHTLSEGNSTEKIYACKVLDEILSQDDCEIFTRNNGREYLINELLKKELSDIAKNQISTTFYNLLVKESSSGGLYFKENEIEELIGALVSMINIKDSCSMEILNYLGNNNSDLATLISSSIIVKHKSS